MVKPRAGCLVILVGAPLLEYRSSYIATHQQEPSSDLLMQEIGRLQAVIPSAQGFIADRKFLYRWRKHFSLPSGQQLRQSSVCPAIDTGGGEGAGLSPLFPQAHAGASEEADDASADQVGNI